MGQKKRNPFGTEVAFVDKDFLCSTIRFVKVRLDIDRIFPFEVNKNDIFKEFHRFSSIV